VTVREALRVLYGEGLIEKGPRSASGGPQVKALPSPSEEEIRDELRQKLRHFIDILDCRMALESFAAAQAAKRRTTEQLEQLDKAMKDMEEAYEAAKLAGSSEASEAMEMEPEAQKVLAAAKFRRAAAVLHRTINEASGNTKLLDILEDLRTESFTKVTVEVLYGDLRDEARLKKAMTEHEEILTAIRDRKASQAEKLMRQHLSSTKEALEARSKKP
jgi:DNA-binding FadR family transcriptional regulator